MVHRAIKKGVAAIYRLQKGFTLVEVLVATVILIIGVLSTLSVAAVTSKASRTNQDQIIASNLAREGIEMVRNIRDSNWAIKSNGNPTRPWDCFPSDLATAKTTTAAGFTCNPGSTFTSIINQNFRINPVTPAGVYGVPYMEVGPAVTDPSANNFYVLCQPSGTPQVYTTPSPIVAQCPNSLTVFRMINIQKYDNSFDGTTSVKVTSTVSWLGKKTPPIVIEEYLSDWKKFN